MLVEAIVGWLVAWAGTGTSKAGHRLVLGSAGERSIRSAVTAAVYDLGHQVPETARGPLVQALLEHVDGLTTPPNDTTAPMRDQFKLALCSVVAPLADANLTETGQSFLEHINVDPSWLLESFPVAVLRSIERVATQDARLAPLAARLDADAIHAALSELLAGIGPVTLATHNSLPMASTDFVGRQRELQFLTNSARVDTAAHARRSIFLIDGMPGVGKTAFALHVAHTLTNDYPDSQLFLDLHGHTVDQDPLDPLIALEMLLTSVAYPIDRIPGTLEARAAVWRAHLSGKRVLLVLDNASDHNQIKPLLPGSSRCLVVITSRRRLVGLDGAKSLTLDNLPLEDAARLFCRIAGRERDAETAVVSRVVSACGYLPLAIQLVAARLRHRPTWTIEYLESKLGANADRLKMMNADDRSVTSAFKVSYDGLSAEHKKFFRLLGMNVSSTLSLHAAAAIGDVPLHVADRLLENLVDQGLLTEQTPQNFHLHDLIREFARRLATEQDSEEIRSSAMARMLAFYLAAMKRVDAMLEPTASPSVTLMPEMSPPVKGGEQALAWFRRELANIVGVTRYALENNLEPYSFGLLKVVGMHLRRLGHVSQASALYQFALDLATGASLPRLQADALHGRAEVRRVTSQHDAALHDYQRAISLFSTIEAESDELDALYGMGVVERLIGRFEDAINHHREAYAGFMRLGIYDRAARSLHAVGRALLLTGRPTEAMSCHQEALSLSLRIGSRREEVDAVRGIAQVQQVMGRYEEALANYRTSFVFYAEIENRIGAVDALRGIAECESFLGDHGTALLHYEESLATAREIGDRAGEGYILNGIAGVEYRKGEYQDALIHVQDALAIAQQCGEPPSEAYCWYTLAEVKAALGDPEQAGECYANAYRLFIRLGMPEAQKTGEMIASLRKSG